MACIINIRTFRLNVRKIFTDLLSDSTGRMSKSIVPSIYINFRPIKDSIRKKISNLGDRNNIKIVETLTEISLPNHL